MRNMQLLKEPAKRLMRYMARERIAVLMEQLCLVQAVLPIGTIIFGHGNHFPLGQCQCHCQRPLL